MLILFVDESLQWINRIVSETTRVWDNYDAAHNAINDSFLEFVQKAKPIIDSYISSLGEFGVEQCSTAGEVRGVAFLFSITGYPRWGWVFYTTNKAMNAAQLSALAVIVQPPPPQPMSSPQSLLDEPPEPSRGYLYIPQGSWRGQKDDAWLVIRNKSFSFYFVRLSGFGWLSLWICLLHNFWALTFFCVSSHVCLMLLQYLNLPVKMISIVVWVIWGS